MIALSCTGIGKMYGIDAILEDISFTVNVGDKVGLIGVNGAGKTTLMKILAGIETKDEGEIFISKEMTTGYLEQNTQIDLNISAFDYCETIFEDIFDIEQKMRSLEKEMANSHHPSYQKVLNDYAHLQHEFELHNGYAVSSKIRGVLNGLGFDQNEHHKPINTLSGGQKSRVGIARLLLRQPDILFLDEPTNHLDIDAIRWLETYLKDYNGTVILISHDRYFLDQVITHVYEIEDHELHIYKGKYSDFVSQKAAAFEAAQKKYEIEQKEIKKQEDLIRKFKERGTEKLAKRAKSREKRLAQLAPAERPKVFKAHFHLNLATNSTSGREILKAENLSKAYDTHAVFKNLTFDIYRGERIGLIGPNGVGKTTLFKILIDALSQDSGSLEWGHQVEKGYYDQELRNLSLEKSVLEEIHDENPHLNLTEVRSLLGAFLFSNDDVDKKIYQLSGGERGRVSMLKLMLSKANTLFLDEPTNHLDIYSKESLEDALTAYEGTIVAISHDRYFLNKIATKIFELTPNGLNVYWGNYDYMQSKKAEQLLLETQTEAQPEMTKTQQKEIQRKEKEQKAELRKLKNRYAEIEKTIASKEEEAETMELKLCDPEVFSNPDISMSIQKDLLGLKAEIEALYSEFEKLLELL